MLEMKYVSSIRVWPCYSHTTPHTGIPRIQTYTCWITTTHKITIINTHDNFKRVYIFIEYTISTTKRWKTRQKKKANLYHIHGTQTILGSASIDGLCLHISIIALTNYIQVLPRKLPIQTLQLVHTNNGFPSFLLNCHTDNYGAGEGESKLSQRVERHTITRIL